MAPQTTLKTSPGGWNWLPSLKSDSCQGQEKNRQEVKDQICGESS